MRRLRIAVVAHVRHPIAAPYMGGMEAHCDALVRGLMAAGHDVTLLASGDSAVDLPLRAIADRCYEAELPFERWKGTPELRARLLATYRRAWQVLERGEFDVVHNNSLFYDLIDWAGEAGMPMVTSLHVPPFPNLAAAVARADGVDGQLFTVCSAQQRALWPALSEEQLRVAWNGVDHQRWRFVPHGNGRAIWAGRITPNKGTLEAIRAASAAGVALDLAGPIDDPVYWEQEVAPVLRAPHRYLGHLSGAALVEAVGAASAMLATPMWDEPFGLTMAEAMSCGVPVAALNRGAVREVVGDSGAIAEDIAALPDALRRAMTIDRSRPRARIERHFTIARMIERYEAAYAGAIASASSVASTRALLA